MKEFDVPVFYDIQCEHVFRVHAETEADAIVQALHRARRGEGEFEPDWHTKPDYYVGDVAEVQPQ